MSDGGCNGYKPSDAGWGRGKHPVVNVNWEKSMPKGYAAWLSRKTGNNYRLLSDAEREYVTRAGTTTPFWWGSSITPTQANYNGSAAPYEGGGSQGEFRQRDVASRQFPRLTIGAFSMSTATSGSGPRTVGALQATPETAARGPPETAARGRSAEGPGAAFRRTCAPPSATGGCD